LDLARPVTTQRVPRPRRQQRLDPPDQYWLSVRLWKRIRPASSTTTADAAGTRLFAFGALEVVEF
jgi:hypothetical protein